MSSTFSAQHPLRLAMWSGPRNISTALMRSWENRSDTTVVDEPFYAHYLAVTGKDHPGKEQVIAAGETDWRLVVEQLTGPVPGGKAIYYQKLMTHHLLPSMGRDWFGRLRHCFLIRHPREMITSYIKIVEHPTLEDTGYPQQTEIFEWVRNHTGEVPPVIESTAVLNHPEATLRALCERMGIPFEPAMLSWPPGPRATDGVWAPHWYAEVEKTTCFRPYRPKDEPVPAALESLYEECLAHYERLAVHRLA